MIRDIGVPVLTKTPRRRPRQLKLLETEQPGDSIQADVKVVKVAKEKLFQYTALDHCTRGRLVRIHRPRSSN